MRFGLCFEFDCEGDPPRVFIADKRGSGPSYVEILEAPTSPLGQLTESSPGIWEWEGVWSWEEKDWRGGPLAKALLAVMNSGHLEV